MATYSTPANEGLPNFDRIARAYKWMEYISFGSLLERCRFAQLGQLATMRRALILGDGDGRFLARMLQVNPEVRADVVDLSASMLLLSEVRAAKVGQKRRTAFYHMDARKFEPEMGVRYDLLVTHFFLDCLTIEEIEALAQRLVPRLHDRAFWLVSEFAIPEKLPWRFIATVCIRMLYIAFRWLAGLQTQTLPDYASVLRRTGFVRAETSTFLFGILRSELWRLG